MSKTARDPKDDDSNHGDEPAAPRSSKRSRTSASNHVCSHEEHRISPAAQIAAANVNRQTLAGRRGDIRMHKAVAARLADPFLSPFEALKIGGFDYPSDEEPTSVDSDKVTLGQRKNQLSRRLRLAKKQLEEDGNSISSNGEMLSGGGTLFGSASAPTSSSSSKNNKRSSKHRKESSEPPLVSEEASCQRPHHHHHQGHVASRKKSSQSHHDTSATRAITEASAIASLMDSAQAMGLTLHQLADTVAANRTYLVQEASAMTNKHQIPKEEKVALRLHAIESKSLYEKSLVLAGADLDKDYAPNSQAHLSYCYHAWQAEGTRLRNVMEEHQYPFDHKKAHHHHHHGADAHQKHTSTSTSHNHDHHNHDHHHHDHNHNNDDLQKPGAFAKQAAASCHNHTGLHLHRLDGQCGHKAVIHRPKDGVPHIDFIVGDVVECYHGVDPIRPNRPKKPKPNEPLMKWQSKYTCDQVDCAADCSADQQQQQQQGLAVVNNPANEDTAAAGPSNHQHDDLTNNHNHTAHDSNMAAVAVAAEDIPTTTTTIPTPSSTTPPTGHIQYHHFAPLNCPPAEPTTIPIHTINENDPQWNFDPEESMDDLLSGLLMANQHHEI